MEQVKLIVSVLFCLLYSNSLYAQTDNVGSGRAIEFDGVDDYIDFGDRGFGGNNPAFRRGKKADVAGTVSRWNHATAVVRAVSDIDLYLNGVNVGNEFTRDSNSPMNSNIPGGHSTAGYLLSNGFTYNFPGIIDDIRLWNKALSQEEIRKTMCVNLKGNESALIGYWDFNETSGNIVHDKSPNKFNGQFVGNPKRVFLELLSVM